MAVAVVVCIAAVCCSRPPSTENFIRIDGSEGGIYSFDLDLSDSLCTYDISFYTALGRQDAFRLRRDGVTCVPMHVVWSRDTASFEETVYLDATEVVTPYRSGVSMVSPGIWKLDVRPVDIPRGFRGIGVICKRNE